MEDKKLTEKESIALITEMISRTKDRYIGSADIMLVWGYLTVAVAIAVWLLLVCTHNGAWNWLWFAIPVIGGTATALMSRKERRATGAVSYSDKITSQLWTAVGLTFAAAAAVCLALSLAGLGCCWSAMFVLALVVTPMAEIVQGIVFKEKSLSVCGGIGLLAGLFTLCWTAAGEPLRADIFMPLFIAAFTIMEIIPGHILNRKYKANR